MLKDLSLFPKSPLEIQMLRQATVQCNEDCKVTLGQVESVIKARVRELLWDGFVVDQIPRDLWDQRDPNIPIVVKFAIPRQFGHVSLTLERIKWKAYSDVISQRDMVLLEVFLTEEEKLRSIRDFLIYRNKSFIRRSKRRLKKTLAEKTLVVFWWFIFLFSAFMGLVFLKDYLFAT